MEILLANRNQLDCLPHAEAYLRGALETMGFGVKKRVIPAYTPPGLGLDLGEIQETTVLNTGHSPKTPSTVPNAGHFQKPPTTSPNAGQDSNLTSPNAGQGSRVTSPNAGHCHTQVTDLSVSSEPLKRDTTVKANKAASVHQSTTAKPENEVKKADCLERRTDGRK